MECKAIGYVRNDRIEVEDDQWSKIISVIELIPSISKDALDGIEAFSHLNIIFYMDKVKDEKAIAQCRHPRNNTAFPKVGTFAQRNKNRPNKLGLTTVELVSRSLNTIQVKNLDAIDGTAILDIKPVMKEFLPQTVVKQPKWSHEIMRNYW